MSLKLKSSALPDSALESTDIETAINAASTNNKVAGAKAVFDVINSDNSYVIIDNTETNMDPASKISGFIGKDYNNSIRKIRNNSHCYVYQGNDETTGNPIMKQLSDSNRTLYADGTDASTDITTKDVFMKLPEFWYKCEEVKTDSNIWKLEFSLLSKTNWNHWEGNTFIGVYEGILKDVDGNIVNPTAERTYTEGDKIYSISGAKPYVYYSQASSKSAARARGTGFQIVTYEAHQIMALLFYAYYGNTNCQSICGSGTSSYPKNTGLRNDLAMTDTDLTNGNQSSINFWGIENWWGDISEWVDNIVTAGSGKVNILNYDGTINRTIQGLSGGDEEIKQLVLGTNADLIPNNYYTDSGYLTYYSDYGFVNSGSGFVAARSGAAAYANGGVAFLGTGSGSAIVVSCIGSRLLYKGDYIIQ